MASLRNPGEADRVHELGGQVIWVDADPSVRYAWIQANKATRGRIEEDEKTFEQFVAEEQAEMTPSGDSATLNMAGVKDKSDVKVSNDGTDIEAFKNQAEQAIAHIIWATLNSCIIGPNNE